MAAAKYGIGDNSYQAAGGFEGVRKLVNTFYDIMEELPEAKSILEMHPKDLELSREKLAYFLNGWLGGPREYAARFGPMNIPQVHRHLTIDTPERDAWLRCMELAVNEQPYSDDFRRYLLEQLAVPANRVLQTSRSAGD